MYWYKIIYDNNTTLCVYKYIKFTYFRPPRDNGYPMKPCLLRLFTNSQSTQQTHCNVLHSCAHSVVERCIGHLKGRWVCSDATGGRLLYHPEKVCKIIRAFAGCTVWQWQIPIPPECVRSDAPTHWNWWWTPAVQLNLNELKSWVHWRHQCQNLWIKYCTLRGETN